MKFEVRYSFGSDWHTQGVYDSMYEAKLNEKALKKHMRNWDGKLLGKVKIVRVEG